MSSRAARLWSSSLLALAAGCSYGGSEMTPVVALNTCMITSDCMDGSECMNGMCVAQKADAPLTIALQVTPARNDGLESLPVLVGPFTVERATTRVFDLAKQLTVRGAVRSIGEPIEAEVSFTPTSVMRGIARKTITRNVTPAVRATGDWDYEVELVQRVEYRMAVRPKDTSLPPQYHTFVADNGSIPVVDYPSVTELPSRTVVVVDEGRNSAGDSGNTNKSVRTFLVRALSQQTGEPISSTATMVDGRAELRFASEPEAFSIEVRAEQSTTVPAMQGSLEGYGYCDTNTPAYPVFTARSEDLSADASGALEIRLPMLPPRIRFEGSVKLCKKAGSAVLTSLPVSLRARSLQLPEGGTKLSASFDATTTATLDEDTDELRFCAQVIPGDYDVVATPVSSMPCALYVAPELTIAAPPAAETASPMLFELPDSAYLSSTLRTMDAMPLRAASIDAIATGGGARSRPATTDANGTFVLQVDLGSYDVVVKPAAGSGLPWQVRYGVEIRSPQTFSTSIDMFLPVTLDGTVRYVNPNSKDPSLGAAVVEAFAIVEDEGGDRAVPIGSSTADAMGHFTLLLPPSIQSGWLAPNR